MLINFYCNKFIIIIITLWKCGIWSDVCLSASGKLSGVEVLI